MIEKVHVISDFDYLRIDNSMSDDYISCSRVTMKQLEFSLTQEYGELVPLHGANISFSLVLDIIDVKS